MNLFSDSDLVPRWKGHSSSCSVIINHSPGPPFHCQPNMSTDPPPLLPGLQADTSFARFDSGGGHVFSYNSNNNGSTVHNHIYTNGKLDQNAMMVQYFWSRSTDYQLAFDNAFGQRTPGTGQWFLQSKHISDGNRARRSISSASEYRGPARQ